MCVWVEDADALKSDDYHLDIVYQNRRVRSFLSFGKGHMQLGLAGIKGQGKTFLLKVKRKKAESNPTVICFPRGRMVDTIDSSFIRAIDDSLFTYLSDYDVWVNLWKLSICGTLISSSELQDQFSNPQKNLNGITKKFLEIENIYCSPTLYFSKLLQYDIKDLLLLIGDTPQLVSQIQQIDKSINVFIDKIDQAMSSYAKKLDESISIPKHSRNASFWQYAQYALAEAAYDLYTNGQHHIKVYFTIRQEALIDCNKLNKDKARNINAFITELVYDKSDLKEMYEIYIRNEDEMNLRVKEAKELSPSTAFVGYNEMKHGYVSNELEDVFDYIYRHSLKRPYDIMAICRQLYFVGSGNSIAEQDLRHYVNERADQLLKTYIEELSIFLPCSTTALYNFFVRIPGNILTLGLMKKICATYISLYPSNQICNSDCIYCTNLQIFSVLHNVGLIGYIKQNPADHVPVQKFENIGNSILQLNQHNLPQSSFYFLHPSLSNLVRESRMQAGHPFTTNNDLIIGDGKQFVVEKRDKIKKDIRKCINQVKKERIFVSSTIEDLTTERDVIRTCILARNLVPIMSERPDFNITRAQKVHSHDLCLDELTKCRSCIFIIGTKYGGIYHGDKYRDIKSEIITNSNGKISEPSISMMEFYLARKKRLRCYVFMDASIYHRVASNDETLDPNIRVEFNFINHFKEASSIRGNWISLYDNIDDLITRVNLIRF